ncbi:MAG: response regulator [Thaumarchaeota archaeon]|nr:MAG: response regulator [Nitrososphaerota archaeon]TLX96307.1 MAG: response regulator [Nitrososphaerota archaeon]
MLNSELEKFHLACTYLRNDQNIAAHNLFMSLAQKEMKNQNFKAGLYLILASECKAKQGKDPKDEILEAAKFYLKLAKKDPLATNYAYRCAAKCLLRVGQYEEAMKIFEEAKKYVHTPSEEKRTIVVVDDSPAIIIRIKSFLMQLGYDDIQTASNGKEALKEITSLIKSGKNPIVLLDMDLPDLTGDVVASALLESKPDLSIILITADEKTAPRVRKTIGLGSTAFVQKPFSINELKNALDTTKLSEVR